MLCLVLLALGFGEWYLMSQLSANPGGNGAATPTVSISGPDIRAVGAPLPDVPVAGMTEAILETAPAISLTAAPTPTPTPDIGGEKKEVRQLLGQLWQSYKKHYLQPDGRVKDPQRADVTTSEGQSYALLRAFWQNDRDTFDRVLEWSLNNLQLPRGDSLFAFQWGKSAEGNWKVLNTSVATDADQDIAFALLMAANRWQEPRYKKTALRIIGDLWDKTVAHVNGQPYLTAGDWAPRLKTPVLNPSYLAPYLYRIFARVDPDKNHDWPGVLDTSYRVIRDCTVEKLDSPAGKLPPNWCAIDKGSGKVTSALGYDPNLNSDFGYDAFRTLWRVALDYAWNGEPRALSYLQSLDFLGAEWKSKGALAAVYGHSGLPRETYEDLGIYSGGALSLFTVLEPEQADLLVTRKLLNPVQEVAANDNVLEQSNSGKGYTYYAQNWLWFGLAFYAGFLPQPAI